MKSLNIAFAISIVSCALALPLAAHASDIIVSNSIQAAVNAAAPGDRIIVPPGVYRENVAVNKSDITITGSKNAILDGEGLAGTNGIRVASSTAGVYLDGFTIDGLTIRNYRRNGILLVRVNNYVIRRGFYENNEAYGIYPIRSNNGVIEGNFTSGSDDAGIYVGQSDGSVIRGNVCFGNTVGIEIENTKNVEAIGNLVKENSVGFNIILLPNLQVKTSDHITLRSNTITNNNRPNTLTDPDEILSRLPDGLGVLVMACDFVTIENNRVMNNDSAGIAVVQLIPELAETDPLVEPFPDHTLVVNNVVMHNGLDPDPRIAPFPGADLLWDLTGVGNTWAGNQYGTSFP